MQIQFYFQESALLEIVSMEAKMNSKFFRNVSLTFRPLFDGFYTINFTAELLVVVEGGYVSFIISKYFFKNQKS